MQESDGSSETFIMSGKLLCVILLSKYFLFTHYWVHALHRFAFCSCAVAAASSAVSLSVAQKSLGFQPWPLALKPSGRASGSTAGVVSFYPESPERVFPVGPWDERQLRVGA